MRELIRAVENINQINSKLLATLFLGFAFSLITPNAWAVTEKEILAADPRKMLKGLVQACKEKNQEKYFSFYTENMRYAFSKKTEKRRAELFSYYCSTSFNEPNVLKFLGSIEKAKVVVRSTDRKENGRPVFTLCLGHASDKNACKVPGGFDIYLENGQVKMDEY